MIRHFIRTKDPFDVYTFFSYENVLYENEIQKPQNFKKMLRKSLAWNAWAATFKNADFSKSSLKVTKLSKFEIFSLFKNIFCLY